MGERIEQEQIASSTSNINRCRKLSEQSAIHGDCRKLKQQQCSEDVLVLVLVLVVLCPALPCPALPSLLEATGMGAGHCGHGGRWRTEDESGGLVQGVCTHSFVPVQDTYQRQEEVKR